MKSVFQKGSSVGSAVEKAWEAAGKPEEFSVKVMQNGQFSFFGLVCSSPFAIGLTLNESKNKHHDSFKKNNDRNETSSTKEACKPVESCEKTFGRKSRFESNSSARPARTDRFDKERKPRFEAKAEEEVAASFKEKEIRSQDEAIECDNWTEALAAKAENFLKEAFDIIDVKYITLSHSFEKHNLNVKISLASDDNMFDKNLAMNLAPLIVQMVKKNNENVNTKGLRLMIES